MKLIDQYLREIEKEVKKSGIQVKTDEVGFVQEIRDGVALLSGLDNVGFGEVIEFESGVKGYVIDITEESVGAVILGEFIKIKSGEQAKALGYTLSVPVSQAVLGRVVNALCVPQDKGTEIKADVRYPIEKIAPGVVRRRLISVPVQTGIKAIDALIPIGRGQRELILGDRGTGKTTIAIDTILNQKNENMICVYCGIGQRQSKIALFIDLLRKNKALEYTVVVNASASESTSLQYIAPYSATAIAEYFMDKGKDVLIVYDDLTKHAWAYRQISLVLRRPAGREAYPGDIFYLHSRLLERSCRLSEKYGGGSITALPIIETLEGDVSAYIPTNIISITDGQIILESDLFNAGLRPAINVGLSVSRVGGNAQTKAMKQVASKLKLDLAQYREMAAFSQFESEMDEATRKLLNRGAKITQILKQDKNKPYNLAEETAVLWAAQKGYLDSVQVHDIEKFEHSFIEALRTSAIKLTTRIIKNKIVGPEDEKELEVIIKGLIPLNV